MYFLFSGTEQQLKQIYLVDNLYQICQIINRPDLTENIVWENSH